MCLKFAGCSHRLSDCGWLSRLGTESQPYLLRTFSLCWSKCASCKLLQREWSRLIWGTPFTALILTFSPPTNHSLAPTLPPPLWNQATPKAKPRRQLACLPNGVWAFVFLSFCWFHHIQLVLLNTTICKDCSKISIILGMRAFQAEGK